MTGRRRGPDALDPAARGLWRKVVETVRPLHIQAAEPVPVALAEPPRSGHPAKRRVQPPAPDSAPTSARARSGSGASKASPPPDTLDGGWDRRLRRGVADPDRVIDLHGHTLASARAALDRALDEAVADEVRLLLVVTGKPPRGDEKRGAIRAAVGDWLAGSHHAGRIAAVRNAHPRHGGAGALYLVLRRRRGPGA